MSHICQIRIGEQVITARTGDRLLDAALMNGCDLPHDCRSGRCGTCVVKVRSGLVIGGETGTPGVVQACQAVVLSDLEVDPPEMEDPSAVSGKVASIEQPSRDVAEVAIRVARPLAWRPGQYVNVTFGGFPARAFSPTVALDGGDRPGILRLHIRRLSGGRVSGEIGRAIQPGHPVVLQGPYGSAYYRPEEPGRLVLFSSGTGFAPIWSIVDATMRRQPGRPMLLVVGSRSICGFYMASALERLSRYPHVTIYPVVGERHSLGSAVHIGDPADLSHMISRGDVVHAAGAPRLVAALSMAARNLDVPFHADPFTPAVDASFPSTRGLMDRLRRVAGAVLPARQAETAPR
jgi:3-phenylpropionate/trans-cinnamate dioxygenase ferredoxin reductase subunit